MFNLTFTPQAKADLRSIVHYTMEKWGQDQADIYLAKLVKGGHRLAENPSLLGRSRSDIHEGVFIYPAEKHVFVFRMTDKNLQILRVLHQSMDLSRHIIGSD